MDVISLHPFDPSIVERYVAALNGNLPPQPGWSSWWNDALPAALDQARVGDERAANRISLGLAWALAEAQPSYLIPGFGLSTWEARIDRGVGMLLRPPSRLFVDSGMNAATARAMPIRLDSQLGMMGGAYVPPRLVPQLRELLESRFERTVRRLAAAEYDPIVILEPIQEAIGRAQEQGYGVFEALDAFGPDGQAMPGMRVVMADPRRVDKALRQRIELARREPKKAGLLARLLGRDAAPKLMVPNGHLRKE